MAIKMPARQGGAEGSDFSHNADDDLNGAAAHDVARAAQVFLADTILVEVQRRRGVLSVSFLEGGMMYRPTQNRPSINGGDVGVVAVSQRDSDRRHGGSPHFLHLVPIASTRPVAAGTAPAGAQDATTAIDTEGNQRLKTSPRSTALREIGPRVQLPSYGSIAGDEEIFFDTEGLGRPLARELRRGPGFPGGATASSSVSAVTIGNKMSPPISSGAESLPLRFQWVTDELLIRRCSNGGCGAGSK
ncbi:hypothetical protein PG984_015608 [Apiospora sp. TS-2023a]